MRNLNNNKVIVAMSGGVDSSVAAAILKQQGYDVVGVMLSLWSKGTQSAENACCTPDAVAIARRVAAILTIPFFVIDAKEIFYHQVVEYFLTSYLRGDTPNPCILCNRKIRWGYLLDLVKTMGASYFATGHYARIRKNEFDLYELRKGKDLHKDQTYMLSTLTQNQLSQTIFPLGELQKGEVREIARGLSLPVAERPESQDLCFIGIHDYRQFIREMAPKTIEPGEIVDRSGTVLGRHEGLPFYTIGQRKGLRVSLGEPVYVVKKNIELNQLVVGTRSDVGESVFYVENFHWISGKPVESDLTAMVKVRYRSSEVLSKIVPFETNRFRFELFTPLPDITPGQQAVVYQDNLCLGGGIICQVGDVE